MGSIFSCFSCSGTKDVEAKSNLKKVDSDESIDSKHFKKSKKDHSANPRSVKITSEQLETLMNDIADLAEVVASQKKRLVNPQEDAVLNEKTASLPPTYDQVKNDRIYPTTDEVKNIERENITAKPLEAPTVIIKTPEDLAKEVRLKELVHTTAQFEEQITQCTRELTDIRNIINALQHMSSGTTGEVANLRLQEEQHTKNKENATKQFIQNKDVLLDAAITTGKVSSFSDQMMKNIDDRVRKLDAPSGNDSKIQDAKQRHAIFDVQIERLQNEANQLVDELGRLQNEKAVIVAHIEYLKSPSVELPREVAL